MNRIHSAPPPPANKNHTDKHTSRNTTDKKTSDRDQGTKGQ